MVLKGHLSGRLLLINVEKQQPHQRNERVPKYGRTDNQKPPKTRIFTYLPFPATKKTKFKTQCIDRHQHMKDELFRSSSDSDRGGATAATVDLLSNKPKRSKYKNKKPNRVNNSAQRKPAHENALYTPFPLWRRQRFLGQKPREPCRGRSNFLWDIRERKTAITKCHRTSQNLKERLEVRGRDTARVGG